MNQPPAGEAVTAGALLRRAREAAGLHVAALAVSLKVPVRKLEALEQDRWDQLPDAVFVRGLAASVCRTLKVDPQPVLERLPQMAAPRLIKVGEGINQTFRSPRDAAPPTWFEQFTRPVFLVVFALLLGALVLVLLPGLQQDEAVAATDSRVPASSAPGVAAPGTVIEAAVPANLPAANAAPVDTPAEPSASPAAPATPTATAMTAMPVPAASAAAGTAAAAQASAPAADAPKADNASTAGATTAASGIIVFRTSQPSWVEVTDAKGVVAVRRVMAAGDAEGASGALPLQVTVGRVDVTEVQVRGKPFDLRAVSRDNVARFQVK